MIRLCIEKLARHHAVDDFDCGQEALNRFLTRYAFINQQANAAQTYLALADQRVIGFYTLVVAEISHNDAPERLSKGLAQHPIPLMLLARLAVSLDWQGKRIGSGLLKDAMLRTVQAADIAGIRAMAAHAKDEAAQRFYAHFGFLPSPTDPLHVFLLTKDIRRAIET